MFSALILLPRVMRAAALWQGRSVVPALRRPVRGLARIRIPECLPAWVKWCGFPLAGGGLLGPAAHRANPHRSESFGAVVSARAEDGGAANPPLPFGYESGEAHAASPKCPNE